MNASGLTFDIVMKVAQDAMANNDTPGFCTECGNQQSGCEPDARDIRCESCDSCTVFGAEEILLCGLV